MSYEPIIVNYVVSEEWFVPRESSMNQNAKELFPMSEVNEKSEEDVIYRYFNTGYFDIDTPNKKTTKKNSTLPIITNSSPHTKRLHESDIFRELVEHIARKYGVQKERMECMK
jgi:hypothetical protein